MRLGLKGETGALNKSMGLPFYQSVDLNNTTATSAVIAKTEGGDGSNGVNKQLMNTSLDAAVSKSANTINYASTS